MHYSTRRAFLKALGVSPAVMPLVMNLPSFAGEAPAGPKKRVVIVFSPNGVIPDTFWPEPGETPLELPESLKPLAPFADRTLILKGVAGRVYGDGDDHMRGMGCLLTGVELLPGNTQGGGHTPAGWASGESIDQRIKNHLQQSPAGRTRFGSLEFGVLVPKHSDVWTRMVYTGANRPVAPIDDPYQMFQKLYGQRQDGKLLKSVLDDLQDDFKRVESLVSSEDRRLLEEHAELVRSMEQSLEEDRQSEVEHAVPELEPDVDLANDNAPKVSRMQIELMVHSFLADATRVATMQYTNSVGQLRLKWIGVDENHHELSHRPDDDADAAEKLTRINAWFCGEVAHLAKRLSETPEPGGSGTMLDNTLIVWTNELGKGNSHTHENRPFVLVGGPDIRGGRTLDMGGVPHNRLWVWLANQFGLPIEAFGEVELCQDGPLTGLA